eukprot:CAMPEP_0198129562 /NCGR_PEP_ID=MMETSP1442-20131203/52025_1 /TAXON_ID= /ORGANISM="Craspedostauros australis, Strain CCMP3328" /LENGTH=41 /DNA_ID= /DNA_START= /DNA_END= /DNA_ORIENTATION=
MPPQFQSEVDVLVEQRRRAWPMQTLEMRTEHPLVDEIPRDG